MSGPDCAVGLLVDLSEPSPEPVKTPKSKKTPRKNGKKSLASEKFQQAITGAVKENVTPTPAVSMGSRRGSITLCEAADPTTRVLVDVTDKNTANRAAINSMDSDAVTPLDEERFDFDFAGSPAIPVKQNPDDMDEEVFFGPVTFSEKCTMASLKSENEVKPLSPLTSSQMAEIVKEAHTIAHQIASMMSPSGSESDRSRSDRNSYSSPIARWKASKRTPKKDGSKTPKKDGSKTPEKDWSKTPKKDGSKTPKKDGSKTPKRVDNTDNDKPAAITTTAKTPLLNAEKPNTEGSGCRSSARLRRSATFTIKDKKPESIPDAIKQSLQFTEGDGVGTDEITSENPEPPTLDDSAAAVNKPVDDKIESSERNQQNKPCRVRQSSSNGIPKPSGLKRPSRMPVPGNRSVKRSSSSESQASCQSVASRRDSFGSEGTADNCSIGSDISDISNASTASNMSTSSRGTLLVMPKSRLSATGVPRPGSKIDTGLGLKRPGIGANRSLQANKSGPVVGKGPLKSGPIPHGLNRSLQMPAVKSKIAGSGKERINSGPVPAKSLNRMSLGTSPSASLRGRTPKTGTETAKNPTPLSSAKPASGKRLSTGPLTRQALTRPGDIQGKTFAANRNRQTPTVPASGPVKAKAKPTSKTLPGVKHAVETPVKPIKSVQPKKLSLSSSFDSPSRNNSVNGHVAASTPRSSSKAANRRSFLPTPTKTMRLESGGSNCPSSPLSFRGVSTSSTKSYGSSLRCGSDSVFEASDTR